MGPLLEYINHIQELRDKLVMCGQTLSYAHLIFHILAGLPEMLEWTTWVMVTKAALLDQNSLAGFKNLKLKELLPASEAELCREKSLLPDQALYTKGRRGNQRRQESTGSATHSVSRVRRKSLWPNSFGGTCYGWGKKWHEKADWWQEQNITAPGGGGRKEGKIRQSLSQRGLDFRGNNDRILLSNE